MDSLEGHIEKIIFKNDENGFCVAKLIEKKSKKESLVVGSLPSIQEGESILCEGEWISHKIYGKQFSIKNYSIKKPCTKEAIEKYLKSGLVKGIGPIYAEKIVKKFGDKTLDIIDEFPEKLLFVDGIGKKRLKMIISCWDEQKYIREVMIFLRSFDITPSFAQKIFKRYGNKSIEIVKENPYMLAKDLFGVGFKLADNLAKKMGIEKCSEKRIDAGIEYSLQQLTTFGHTCYLKDEFIKMAAKILDIEESYIPSPLENLIKSNIIIESILDNKPYISLRTLHNFEIEIAEKLIKIKNEDSHLRSVDNTKALQWVEKILNIDLAINQKLAIEKSINNKLHIITGGPGTGKSTITKAILEIYSKLTKKIILAAPTGKAAKRMTQITRKKAHTIHSILEFDFKLGKFKKNEENKLKCDLIIIDECSMIDTLLMHHLLKAIPSTATLIFVGDIDQLPSIGPGYVLKDMIVSKAIETTILTEIFRQAKHSKIITNAHKINEGIFPSLSNSYDFMFYEEEDTSKILEKIIEIYFSDEFKKICNIDPINSLQILSPMKKGIIGTENINIEIQQKLNLNNSKSIILGTKKFYENDKVIQIKNNYDKNVFNGDIGIIKKIDQNDQIILIEFGNKLIEYDFSEIDEILLAYSISVHKYQGSECKNIIIPVHTSHFKLLYRNLLYTAITRGKKKVVLIGSKKAISIAINNKDILKRFTLLKHKLIKANKSFRNQLSMIN